VSAMVSYLGSSRTAQSLTSYISAAFGGLLNATFGNAVELIISIRESSCLSLLGVSWSRVEARSDG
jgi:hypothetical protein